MKIAAAKSQGEVPDWSEPGMKNMGACQAPQTVASTSAANRGDTSETSRGSAKPRHPGSSPSTTQAWPSAKIAKPGAVEKCGRASPPPEKSSSHASRRIPKGAAAAMTHAPSDPRVESVDLQKAPRAPPLPG